MPTSAAASPRPASDRLLGTLGPGTLGIVAGGGDIPARLVAACRERGRPCFVVALEGQAQPGLASLADHAWVRLGAGGRFLDLLRQHGVDEIVFAGAVRRPSLLTLMPDWRVARFLAKVGLGMLGDNSLLTLVLKEVEAEGFRVIGIDDVLTDMLAPVGPYGRLRPDEAALADIRRGLDVAALLGRADVGQAVVVQQGMVLAVEAIEGTDAMLARCGSLRRDGPGGVLVKCRKPQQERRIDLPTIGAETVENAAAAGLRGIAVTAGGALVVDRAAAVTAADRLGLFLVGVDASAGSG